VKDNTSALPATKLIIRVSVSTPRVKALHTKLAKLGLVGPKLSILLPPSGNNVPTIAVGKETICSVGAMFPCSVVIGATCGPPEDDASEGLPLLVREVIDVRHLSHIVDDRPSGMFVFIP
tara:strand:- start:183 stop:542 length:360 start_codon:yes stop_codon:yes gene_type:complete